MNAIMMAARGGHANIIEYFISKNHPVNGANKVTYLMDRQWILLILFLSAPKIGLTPLFMAIATKNQNPHVVKLLVERGNCNPNLAESVICCRIFLPLESLLSCC